jgi:integrase
MTIRQRGDGWQAIARVKRNGVLVVNQARTFETEALAKAWKAKVLKNVRTNGAAAHAMTQRTLKDLIDMYRKARNEVKPMRRQMEHELDQLTGAVGSWQLDRLSSDQFVSFARTRRRDGAGAATVLHNLATLRAVLGAAKPMFGIDVSAAPVSEAVAALGKMGHVAKSECRERRPTAAELDNLAREFARIEPHPSTEILMTRVLPLAIALPRRIGELCDMTWEDYNERTITLRDTKHPLRPRTEVVPVPPEAKALIDEMPKIDARILPYKSESVTASFQRACARLGIEDLHFHDLRHEGICRLFERGLAIQEVALISGHQSWNMLRRYTHLRPEDVLEKLK